MNKTKTIYLLMSLTKGELNGLKHFLGNPLFNKNTEVKTLFDFIASFAPKYSEVTFTKDHAFSKIYPKREFDQIQFNYIINKLNTRIEKFLAMLELNQDHVDQELKLLNYTRRKVPKYFDSYFNKTSKFLKANHIQGVELLYTKFKIEYQLAIHYSNIQPKKERNLSTLLTALDHYSNYEKLAIYCEMLNHSLIMAYPYDFSMVRTFLDHLTEAIYNPLLELWNTATATLLHVKEKMPIESSYYFSFKKQLFEYKEQLDHNGLRSLLTYLTTVLNRTEFNETDSCLETFNLYQFGLERKAYLVNGYLLPQDVKNIVTASLGAEQKKWLISFLTDCEKYFHKSYANELKSYCNAVLCFERKNYSDVLKALDSLEFKDVFFDHGIRILQIKVFYELEEVDKFEAAINSATTNATRCKKHNKIANHHIQRLRNFCNKIYKIYKLLPKDPKINQIQIKSIPINKLQKKSGSFKNFQKRNDYQPMSL